MKPGIKTTEFWVTSAIVIAGGCLAFFNPTDSWVDIVVGLAIPLCTSVHYTTTRAELKHELLKSKKFITDVFDKKEENKNEQTN